MHTPRRFWHKRVEFFHNRGQNKIGITRLIGWDHSGDKTRTLYYRPTVASLRRLVRYVNRTR